jgi:hypothetical protein
MYTDAAAEYAYVTDAVTEQTAKYHVQFWIYPASGVTPDECYILNLNDAGTGAQGVCGLDDVAGVCKLLNLKTGNTWETVGTLTYDAWNKVDLYVDKAADNIGYYIGGVDQGDFDIFNNARNFDKYILGDTSGGAQLAHYYVDDILVDDVTEHQVARAMHQYSHIIGKVIRG